MIIPVYVPHSIKKYLMMSKRQRRNELQSTVWYTPFVYIVISMILVAVTLYLDLAVDLSQYISTTFSSHAKLTRLLVSTLIGGILTLSAFTFNSLLVALTTFSGQFSPRMLLNFVADKTTQRILGIFNGSFVYVLLVFLFISNQDKELFTAVPLTTVLLAFTSAITFIYFINHTTSWMQVHNITDNMKNISKHIINESLLKETEPFRVKQSTPVYREGSKGEENRIYTKQSGYLQLVDYIELIEEARKDDTVVKLEYGVGQFVLEGTPVLTYWQEPERPIDEKKYRNILCLGHKQTEMQDLEFGLNKLAEIAIKAIGNNDPKTVANTIHQMADLLRTISRVSSFSPYLVDKNNVVRVILKEENFKYYLYKGFAYIRYYARDDSIIITEIIDALALMAKAMADKHHNVLWEFADQTVQHFKGYKMYEADRQYLMKSLFELARNTNHIDEFKQLKNEMAG